MRTSDIEIIGLSLSEIEENNMRNWNHKIGNWNDNSLNYWNN